MIWLSTYLYVMGAVIMWWFARSRNEPNLAKFFAVLFWPILVPMVALIY